MKKKDVEDIQTTFDTDFEKSSDPKEKNKEKVNETVISPENN